MHSCKVGSKARGLFLHMTERSKECGNIWLDYCGTKCETLVQRSGYHISRLTGDTSLSQIIWSVDRVASVARPLLQLVGFNRVAVPAGETVTCKFRIDLSQFAYFDEAMDFAVEPGEVEVLIGASSEDIRLQQTVRLTGERRLLSQRQIVATQATAP